MDKKLLVPFINAGSEVIYELSNKKPRPGKASIIGKKTDSLGIVIIIGITGDISGRIIVDLSLNQAHKFSEIILQEKIEKNNMELIESAIGEFGNMLSGRAITKLDDMGYRLRLTPPTILKGNALEIYDQFSRMLVIPFLTIFGEIFLNLSVKHS